VLIDVTQKILGYEGEDLPTPTGVLTFREAVFQALNSVMENENPPVDQKERIYAVTSKVYASPVAEIAIEDAALIKERSGMIMSPLVHGRICAILESANQLTAIEP